jgi:hypothetical protein
MAVDLVAGKLGGEDEQRVGFAYDIGVKFSKNSATSYEYTVRPLMESKASDAMEELKATLPAVENQAALTDQSETGNE